MIMKVCKHYFTVDKLAFRKLHLNVNIPFGGAASIQIPATPFLLLISFCSASPPMEWPMRMGFSGSESMNTDKLSITCPMESLPKLGFVCFRNSAGSPA